ncbi:MAG: HAD-IIA family hydrolase [Austwickia sp.]|nr:HAD-IIA family hydrolase [Austwickia sp.]MBK8435678.1 HAD-IIA family hydrolase [Austwickia sp.]MBK9100753.1 HAD-IIA family hydrolase [Austwickia sp.]
MTQALVSSFRGIVCDLDGVVYRSHEPIPYAVEALETARGDGVSIAYATNNAGREPAVVAAQLRELGLDAPTDSVVNSSMAGAAYLADSLPADATVLAVGGPGVSTALSEVGLRPVRASDADRSAGEKPLAVLQGYGPEVSWRDLAVAAFAIQAGAQWVATNLDATIPTSDGIAPGNGSLVQAVRAAVSVDPVAVGKPETPLYELCARRLGCRNDQILAIGDRLDTDIIGANRAGMPSLLVTTGVHQVEAVCAADDESRPRYLAVDLRALHAPYTDPIVDSDSDGHRWTGRCGEATVSLRDGQVVLGDSGCPETRLRALVALVWAARDARDRAPATTLGIDDETWRRISDWLAPGDPR